MRESWSCSSHFDLIEWICVVISDLLVNALLLVVAVNVSLSLSKSLHMVNILA